MKTLNKISKFTTLDEMHECFETNWYKIVNWVNFGYKNLKMFIKIFNKFYNSNYCLSTFLNALKTDNLLSINDIVDFAKKELSKIAIVDYDIEEIFYIEQYHRNIQDDIYLKNKHIYYSILDWRLFQDWYIYYYTIYHYKIEYEKDPKNSLIGFMYIPSKLDSCKLQQSLIFNGIADWNSNYPNCLKIKDSIIQEISNCKTYLELKNKYNKIIYDNENFWMNLNKKGIIIKNKHIFNKIKEYIDDYDLNR